MKKKFFVACALAATMALGAASLSACGNGNNYSETYAGTISQQSYETQEIAAEAFLNEEINCKSETASLVSYEKKSDLSQSEIDSLSLTAEEKASVTSAEKGAIVYSVSSNSAASDYASQPTYSKTIYILKMGNAYRYYDPAPANGEPLSNSYFESVFNSENYKNCTMEMSIVSESSAQGQTMTLTMDYACKITETEVSIVATTKMEMNGQKQSQSIEAYIVDNNGLQVVGGVDGQYTTMDINSLGLNIEKLEDLASMSLPEYLDISYFEKTDTGFKMKDEKVNDFLAQYMNSNPAFAQFPINNMSAGYDFGVSEGKLCEGSSFCTINMSYQGVSVSATASSKYKYHSFGNTSVTIPDAAKTLLGIN